VAQVLARLEAQRHITRHLEAEHVLGVVGDAARIAMAPDRVDLVDRLRVPIAQAVGRHDGPADGDAGFLGDLADRGLAQRLVEPVLRAGDALPVARPVGPLEQQDVELGV
jgi:hypothetical protein